MAIRTTGRKPIHQRSFRFDQAGCIGCSTCQIACKDLHDLPVGVNWRRVTTLEYGKFPQPKVLHVSMSCNHCARPACIKACPSDAITKRHEDGVVVLEASRCTGCKTCIDVCLYSALQYNEATGRVGKCDMCLEFLTKGREPACVSSCMMRVLQVGWLEEMGNMPQPRGRELPEPARVGPSLRIIPHRYAR